MRRLVLVAQIRSWFTSWNQFSQRITAASAAQIRPNVIPGVLICLARGAHNTFPAYCTYTAQFIIFALGKSLLAWKACASSPGRASWHWCRRQAAAVSFTLAHTLTDVEVARICQGTPQKPSARAAPAINISGSNNQGAVYSFQTHP